MYDENLEIKKKESPGDIYDEFQLEELMKLIKKERFNNYSDWVSMGRIFYSLDKIEGKNIWIRWNKKMGT